MTLCIEHFLGFDLVDVGKDEITLKAGKQANRRTLQFGLQALVAVFGEFTSRIYGHWLSFIQQCKAASSLFSDIF